MELCLRNNIAFSAVTIRKGNFVPALLLLCSHSHYDVSPEPQQDVSMAAIRGSVCPSICSSFLIKPHVYSSAEIHLATEFDIIWLALLSYVSFKK